MPILWLHSAKKISGFLVISVFSYVLEFWGIKFGKIDTKLVENIFFQFILLYFLEFGIFLYFRLYLSCRPKKFVPQK